MADEEGEYIPIDDSRHPANVADCVCKFLGVDLSKKPTVTRLELVIEGAALPVLKLEYELEDSDFQKGTPPKFFELREIEQ